jgi:hypothetical protein
MISVIGVCWIYTKFYFKDSTSMSFSPWLFVIGTIFEETSSAPVKLEKKTFYRLSIGLWCLMVVFLTNCYNGLMITGLNSPLPGIKIESFRDLLCDQSLFDAKPDFNISQWIETSKISPYWGKFEENYSYQNNTMPDNPYDSKDCFRIWSPALVTYQTSDWGNYSGPSNFLFFELGFHYLYLKAMITSYDLLPYSKKILTSFLHTGHAYEPEMITKIRNKEKRNPTISEANAANQLEITNCPKKSAYIASSQEIAMELDFLSRNYNRKKFYMGKDLLEEKFEGLRFANVRNTKVQVYYRILIETGIYGRLMIEKNAKENRFRTPVKMTANLRLEGVSSLEGGLVTLFILCGAVISLAGIAFSIECWRIVWESLIKSYKTVSNGLKMLAQKKKSVKFRKLKKIHVEIDMIEVKPK